MSHPLRHHVMCSTSLAVQSEIRPLNPIMSPKKIVTQSKCSASAVISPPCGEAAKKAQKYLTLPTKNILSVSINFKETHFAPLHIAHNRRRQKIMKGFLCLHFFCIKLSDLFHHFFCKNLNILWSLKCRFISRSFTFQLLTISL